MTTLRRQVVVALLLTMAAAWATVFAIRYNEIRRAGTGLLDTGMRDSARQALLSIPPSLLRTPHVQDEAPFELPSADSRTSEKAFQVWSLADKRVLLRSPWPEKPLVENFEPGFHDISVNGEPWRVYALSDVDGRVQVQFAKSEKQLRADAIERMRSGVEFLTFLFIILTVVTWLVMRHAFRAVDRAREAISRRSDMDLTPLPTAGLPGELQPFIRSINALLLRLSASLDQERRFLADAAHELRTPLSALTAFAELAGDSAPHVREQAVMKLRDVASRTTRLIEQLLDHARMERLNERPREAVDLDRLAEMIARDSEVLAARKDQRIALQLESAIVSGDLDALGVLLRNLVDNALRYTPAGGRVAVACGTLPNGEVRLSVADNGPGIAPAERERVFDRFYRVPGSQGSGSGIGLSLVAHIAASHGARMDWAPGLDGRGIALTLTFAAAGRPAGNAVAD